MVGIVRPLRLSKSSKSRPHTGPMMCYHAGTFCSEPARLERHSRYCGSQNSLAVIAVAHDRSPRNRLRVSQEKFLPLNQCSVKQDYRDRSQLMIFQGRTKRLAQSLEQVSLPRSRKSSMPPAITNVISSAPSRLGSHDQILSRIPFHPRTAHLDLKSLASDPRTLAILC
jgi:hypothetical protein